MFSGVKHSSLLHQKESKKQQKLFIKLAVEQLLVMTAINNAF
jgi:hypothetical protein